ncbi:MAG: glycosyltransferase family 4 protein [Verrucomicrobiales bacterium]
MAGLSSIADGHEISPADHSSLAMRNHWVVCQIGAREHYAVARALHQQGRLVALLTDFWVSPGLRLGRIPALRRLSDRYHPGLKDARVQSSNIGMLSHELTSLFIGRNGWSGILARNARFQAAVIRYLKRLHRNDPTPKTLFSYSYAGEDLLCFAKKLGWRTVLGQIDPGPEEERIVAKAHADHPSLTTRWQPAPAQYWDSWRREVALADTIVVNSTWSRDCLVLEGVAQEKLRVVPLAYGGTVLPPDLERRGTGGQHRARLEVLFLGQITLRKGIAPLLEAMNSFTGDRVRLTLVGPSDLAETAWSGQPNIRWLGPVARSGVGEVYQSADVFVLPTLSDGFALTQIEAMAHGLPVISTANCGEVVRHGVDGLVVPAGDSRALAEAIRRFDDDREFLERASEAARDRAKDYSLESVGPAWTRLANDQEALV